MTDVFISYSRRDKVFVRRLFDALEAQGRESWVDWESIPYSAEWWREIQTGIEVADTLIFVITPDSLGSRICNDEFAYALKLNKRIIPVIRRDIDERQMAGIWFNQTWEQQARTNWETLKKLNWLFMRRKDECECQYDDEQQIIDPTCDGPDCDYDDFAKALNELTKTLETDIEHVKTHTRLLVRAQEWETNQRNRSYLLAGDDLRNAEFWLAASGAKEPKPTELHTQYILASRSATTARQRTTVGALAFGLAVAVSLAALSFILFQQSERNLSVAVAAQATSERRADESRSLALAAAAQQSQIENQVMALALAVEANQMTEPPAASQRILADLAYGPGAIRAFPGNINLFTTIIGIAISADGQTIISATSGGTFHVFDIMPTTVILKTSFFAPDGANWSAVSFSADAFTAVTGGADGKLTLWDLQTGTSNQSVNAGDAIYSVVLHPNGRMAAAGLSNGAVVLWDTQSGELIPLLEASEDQNFNAVTSVAFSPDGQRLLSTSNDGSLILWEVETAEQIGVFNVTGSGFTIRSAIFHPDGERILSASDDAKIQLWDMETRTVLREYRGANTTLPRAIFSPDGRQILAVVGDGSLLLWDTDTGRLLHRFAAYPGASTAVTFSNDGFTAVSASEDGEVILWDIIGSRDRLLTTMARPNLINAMILGHDGHPIAVTSDEEALVLEDRTTGEELSSFPVDAETISSVAFSPDQQTILFGSLDGTLTLWDIATRELIRTFRGHQAAINAVAFSPDGQTFLSGSSDTSAILWDVTTGEPIHTFGGYQAAINAVAFSPDGLTALSASEDGTVILWDLRAGTLQHLLVGHSDAVNVVSFSHDGTMAVSGSRDRMLKLWDLTTGQLLRTLEGQNGSITSAAFMLDDSMILSSAVGTTIFSPPTAPLILWDVDNGQILRTFGDDTTQIYDVILSEDSKSALSASSDGTLILWRIDTLAELLARTYTNRYIPELTCEQRALYGIEVQCDATGVFPTRTPFPTLTPLPTLLSSDS